MRKRTVQGLDIWWGGNTIGLRNSVPCTTKKVPGKTAVKWPGDAPY